MVTCTIRPYVLLLYNCDHPSVLYVISVWGGEVRNVTIHQRTKKKKCEYSSRAKKLRQSHDTVFVGVHLTFVIHTYCMCYVFLYLCKYKYKRNVKSVDRDLIRRRSKFYEGVHTIEKSDILGWSILLSQIVSVVDNKCSNSLSYECKLSSISSRCFCVVIKMGIYRVQQADISADAKIAADAFGSPDR